MLSYINIIIEYLYFLCYNIIVIYFLAKLTIANFEKGGKFKKFKSKIATKKSQYMNHLQEGESL